MFMYPHLLPHGGLFKSSDLKRDRSRVRFLECEDKYVFTTLALSQVKINKNFQCKIVNIFFTHNF